MSSFVVNLALLFYRGRTRNTPRSKSDEQTYCNVSRARSWSTKLSYDSTTFLLLVGRLKPDEFRLANTFRRRHFACISVSVNDFYLKA